MNFVSITYMVFFTIIIVFYYKIAPKCQWQVLLIGSMVFYAFSSIGNLFVLCTIIAITYFGGLSLGKIQNARGSSGKKQKDKACIALVVVLTLAILGFFKYYNIAFRERTGSRLSIAMPLGMSFFVFSSLGYCIDVYRKEITAEKNIFKYALFVSFFPHLLEGPIANYSALNESLFSEHTYSPENLKFGLQRCAWGFFKKVVIANQVSVVMDPILSDFAVTYGAKIIFGVVLYSIWLYSDFSGFIDIAIGSAECLGIRLTENFSCPYFSKSIAEYWRRWHMSLGQWFQKYLFYSVLRSKGMISLRKKVKKVGFRKASQMLPTVISLFVTWTLIGVWHGAEINFPIHGLYYGILMILSYAFGSSLKKIDEAIRWSTEAKNAFRVIRTYVLTLIGFLIFWPANIHVTVTMAGNILHGPFISRDFISYLYQNIRELLIIIPSVMIFIAVDCFHYRNEKKGIPIDSCALRLKISRLPWYERYTLYVLLVVAIMIFGNYGSGVSNQFAYFRF